MIFKIKNPLFLDSLKTFRNNNINNFYYFLIKLIKKNFSKQFICKSLICLSDLVYFKINNIDIKHSDKFNNIDSKIFIFLPFKCLKTNKLIIYLLATTILQNYQQSFLINGLKKVYVPKLVNSSSLFFGIVEKSNKFIYCAKIFINTNNSLNIILNENDCYIVFKKKKYTLVTFCLVLNINLYELFINLPNDKWLILKLILKKYIYISKKYISNIFFNLNVFKKELLKLKNNNSFFITGQDIAYILNILFDIKFNKRKIYNIDNINNLYIKTLYLTILDIFSKNINKQLNEIKLDLFKVNKTKLRSINTLQTINKIPIKEFLTINPQIQFLDETNCVSELSNLCKIIKFNSQTCFNLKIRDIGINQLGSLCLLETPEGINCGLIGGLAIGSKLTRFNKIYSICNFINHLKTIPINYFISTINKETHNVVFSEIDREKNLSRYVVNSPVLFKNIFYNKNVLSNLLISFINPNYVFSYAENLIPFMSFNEPIRSLMAAKMYAQSLPNIIKNKTFLYTGFERNIMEFLHNQDIALQEGIITKVSSTKIFVRDIYKRNIIYILAKFKKNNQNIMTNQTPKVWVGERVFSGQILSNRLDSKNNLLSLGDSINILYGNFFGYNFEDALVINKKVVFKRIFSSLNFSVIENCYKIFNSSMFEISMWNIPKIGFINKHKLDFLGFIKIGQKVSEKNILASKILVKTITILPLIDSLTKLIKIFFGTKIRELKDKSLLVPKGSEGKVIKLEIFSLTNNTKFNKEIYLKIRVYILKQRLLSIGDKLCGRHGNKGIVSYIANTSELPYSKEAFIPDIITESLGIPSRMNLGQLFESLLGFNNFNRGVCLIDNKFLNYSKYAIKELIYNNMKYINILSGNNSIYSSLNPGNLCIRDGRTGFKLLEPSLVGISKYAKLIHMVKDKIHYRTIGPYTMFSNQPPKGRKNLGGQRFGEMEVWALEAYGHSYNLKELLNYKSDDLKAKSYIKDFLNFNNFVSRSSTSLSFKSLLKEIYGLSLNLETFLITDTFSNNILQLNIS